jgi:putative endonuclease
LPLRSSQQQPLQQPPRPPASGARVRTPKQRAGAAAEDAACAHLAAHGLRIVARNVRFKVGELDIIAAHGALLVFVVVRRRSSRRFGSAAASVDAFKRRRLVRAAQCYLQAQARVRPRWPEPACRFDVVAVDGDRIEWIVNAFGSKEEHR